MDEFGSSGKEAGLTEQKRESGGEDANGEEMMKSAWVAVLLLIALCLLEAGPLCAQHKQPASRRNKPRSANTQARDWWRDEEKDPIKIVSLRMVVPFAVRKGQLVVCIKHSSEPPQEAVYLISSTPPRMPASLRGPGWARCLFEVKTLDALRGYVRIETPSQALAYVRLLTSPRTFGCFPRSQPRLELEVVSRDTVTLAFMFGDRREAKEVKGFENGWWGVLDRSWAKRYRGLFAICTPAKDGFLVKRTFLIEEWNEGYQELHHLERVEEWVGQDGRYLLQKRTRLPDSASPPANWYIPKDD